MSNFPDTIYVIQHVAFEDLGSLEDTFYQLGFRVRYFEAGVENLNKAFEHQGLTIILGGPIGVNDVSDYPFLQNEIDLLKVRLEKNLPTIGICLGAQLIAAALNSKVYTGSQIEIGWSKLQLNNEINNPLAPLQNIEVLHWHGDTFDLPVNAQLLAGTEVYPHQAFSINKHILALQFHIEASRDSMEKWLIGHTCELKQREINIKKLREDNRKFAPQLEFVANQIIKNYMISLTN